MITVPFVPWCPFAAMPEDRKDGHQLLFAFEYEDATVNVGPPKWSYTIGRWWCGRWFFDNDDGKSIDPGIPQYYADLNPPG